MKWKKGDHGWRGYARHYGNPREWFPEIRPVHVSGVNSDGTLRCHMRGPMPGTEGKRNPGSWTAWGLDPGLMFETPEMALRAAKRIAIDANAEAGALSSIGMGGEK